jgi:pimeloyl-ACP methyl ester carboxylesterase
MKGGGFQVMRLQHDAWVPYHGGLRRGERVLLLTHGVMENIGTAFPAKTARSIQAGGGYDDVLGVSYDWSEPTVRVAPHFADLLRSLPTASFDVEAHSYGAINALAGLERSGLYPQNIILLGAPLEGTPFASSTPLTDLIEQAPPGFWNGMIGQLQHMHADGAQSELTPHSATLKALNAGLAALAHKGHAHIILIAGTDEQSVGPLANIYFQAFGLEPIGYYDRNDGVIPLSSALAESGPALPDTLVTRRFFALRHAQLRTDANVIAFIDQHLARR